MIREPNHSDGHDVHKSGHGLNHEPMQAGAGSVPPNSPPAPAPLAQPVSARRKYPLDGELRGKLSPNSPLHTRLLTKKELGVLRVIMNPAYNDLSRSERIALSGCSEPHYKRILRDPAVREEQRRMMQDMLAEELGPILQKSAEVAKNYNRDGFQDRQMLLKLQGLIGGEGGNVNVNIGSGAKKMVVGVVGINIDDV